MRAVKRIPLVGCNLLGAWHVTYTTNRYNGRSKNYIDIHFY